MSKFPKPEKDAGTLYDRLQVLPTAHDSVIVAAAKELLKRHHPDKGGDANLCSRINEAKGILSDKKQRKEYNDFLSENAGSRLGNYKLVRRMSEGGFGRVYEAIHTKLGERVVIKQNLNISDYDTEIFIKEAKAIWDLRHHSLPAVRDMFFLPDGSCALVMSYIEGPTLAQVTEKYRKKKKRLHPENVSWIMERVLDGLRYMHYHGVVHGDVKPQNIIVQPEVHTCALVDFGLANIRPSSTSKAEGFTKDFAPPEAYKGMPLLPESDLYSLGMTSIYAFGGDPSKRQVPKDVPPGIREFISRLIVYDTLARPHWDEVDLVQDLRKVRVEAFGREHTNFKKL